MNSRFRVLCAISILAVAVCACAASVPSAEEPIRKPLPPAITRLGSINLPPAIIASNATVSDSGRWLAFTTSHRERDDELILVSLADGESQVIASVERRLLEAGTLVLRGLGFTADSSRYIFARQGTQPDGQYRSRRGVLLYAYDTNEQSVEEVAWLGVRSGNYVNQYYFLPEGDVLIYEGDSVWRLDADSGSAALVVRALSGNFGSHNPVISNSGSHLAYPRLSQHVRIHITDVTSGEEIAIDSQDSVLCFYPSWSPSGELLACYSAPRAEDGGYSLISMEDGAYPAAQWLDVFRTEGTSITRYEVSGYWLASKTWSRDSSLLAFFGVVPDLSEPGLCVTWKALYYAGVHENPTKMADLPELKAWHASVVRVSSHDAHALIYTAERDRLYHVQDGLMHEIEIPYGRLVASSEEAHDGSFIACIDTGRSTDVVIIRGTSVQVVASGTEDSCCVQNGGSYFVWQARRLDDSSELIVFRIEAEQDTP